jgi:phage terminase large subunit GpA-like protein
VNSTPTYLSEWPKLWKAPEQLPLSQWAEKNIVLSSEYSARTGPLQLYGWQKGILDAFTDPRVETIVLMCGTQLIKTLFIQCATAYVISQAPAPTLIVQYKEKDVEDFSKERLDPMIRDCEVLQGKFGSGKKDPSNTILFKRFPGGSLALVGAGASGNAARRSICYAFLDEIDEYVKDVDGHGDFVSLVQERTATFGSRRKIILVCSPTTKHGSRIGKAYENSDQRKPWVKCHACGEWQVLGFFQHVKFDEGRGNSDREPLASNARNAEPVGTMCSGGPQPRTRNGERQSRSPESPGFGSTISTRRGRRHQRSLRNS